MSEQYDVIVIGGGASGMMAAGRAAERGRRVLLLEKNAVLGKKLAMTGGGRCNITNAEDDVHRLLAHFGDGERFLYSPFSQFGVSQTFTFFTDLGLPLKVEARQRAFPETEKATDVVRVLKTYMENGRVTVRPNAIVTEILYDESRITGVRVGDEMLTADAYIFATGGSSHPETGSTGDGWRWLTDLGLTVQNSTPTVVPLAASDAWIHSLAGMTLPNAKITFFAEGKKEFAVQGSVLCTHFGLSGPTILNAAGRVADLTHRGTVSATIDVAPEYDLGALDAHITTIFDANKNRNLGNVMKIIAPTGTAAAVLSLVPDIDPETKVHSVSKEDRKKIVHLLKALPVTITGLMGFDRAVVADGGLDIREIDGKTMRLRKYENCFVTGDMLNIRRPSGGFSLQLCWTTGWVAGSNA